MATTLSFVIRASSYCSVQMRSILSVCLYPRYIRDLLQIYLLIYFKYENKNESKDFLFYVYYNDRARVTKKGARCCCYGFVIILYLFIKCLKSDSYSPSWSCRQDECSSRSDLTLSLVKLGIFPPSPRLSCRASRRLYNTSIFR